MKNDEMLRIDMGGLRSGDVSATGDAPTLCLGIESSCDETSAAIVDSDRNILAHIIYSQIPQHQKYGGVVPELAARAHILAIDDVVRRTLDSAGKTISDRQRGSPSNLPGVVPEYRLRL